jgi:hypothetical protein
MPTDSYRKRSSADQHMPWLNDKKMTEDWIWVIMGNETAEKN